MALIAQIKQSKQRLREGAFTSEAAVSQGVLLPILHALGWPVFDTSTVIPEYSVEGRRVDYALCHPAKQPCVFIEVKKVGLSQGSDRQLFEYAFHIGVPMAILTDGQEWSFYLPGEQGSYDQRRIYKLDLLERDEQEAEKRLERYLNYAHVCSGEALRSARADYQNVARDREIVATFPRAWRSLIEEQDSILIDLLAEKVEDLCGYKPDSDKCGRFIKSVIDTDPPAVLVSPNYQRAEKKVHKTSGIINGRYSFSFKGRKYEARSSRDVMIKLFKLLIEEDATFLDRFASRKHGKKRRYLAQNKYELYPDRPDLCEEHSVEITAGWWLGTNYSRNNIQIIIDLAREVAGPKLGRTIIAKVD